ncbi:homoserine kinase [Nonomuraea soli]|uniref:Homoserine kinase n=1 Tax=Nonomuraea soli TaxID=1032476 RepID=A0A7W0HRI4_9ACTN|nr:homoserine kinase [Nonomuraea soli]
MSKVVVRVPATSANLGPGFDSLGLALAHHDHVEAELVDGESAVVVEGAGAGEVGDGEEHLIVRVMRTTFARMGVDQPAGIRLRCRNIIPHARGMGSSSAAIVAGIYAARALAGAAPDSAPGTLGDGAPGRDGSGAPGHDDSGAPGRGGSGAAGDGGSGGGSGAAGDGGSGAPGHDGSGASGRGGSGARPSTVFTDDDVFALATELEGHPDNVAPCIFGGLTISWSDQSGIPRMVKLTPDAAIQPVVLIPSSRLSTETARGLLPKDVPHKDASFNSGRSALLIAALTQRPESSLLLAATEDRLHQNYRAPAMRKTADLVERLRSRGVPAVVSGAGPTILVFSTTDTQDLIAPEVGNDWLIQHLDVDPDGAGVQVPETR